MLERSSLAYTYILIISFQIFATNFNCDGKTHLEDIRELILVLQSKLNLYYMEYS